MRIPEYEAALSAARRGAAAPPVVHLLIPSLDTLCGYDCKHDFYSSVAAEVTCRDCLKALVTT